MSPRQREQPALAGVVENGRGQRLQMRIPPGSSIESLRRSTDVVLTRTKQWVPVEWEP